MRKRSKVWTKLAARGQFSMESMAVINGKEYRKISAPKIDRQLMTAPLSVGGCCNASLTFSVMLDEGDTIPEGAEIVIKARLFNTKLVSEWLEFGTFYIDKREDEYMGLVKLTCYDAMLKTEQQFVADDNFNTLGWPKSMQDVVVMIAQRLGVGIDPRTQIKTGADYVVPLPTGLTVRQVLGYIAACHGGNWMITEENMLRLVPLVQVPNETFKIISADYEDIIVPPNDTLVWRHPTDPAVAEITGNAVAKVTISDKARRDYHIVDKEGNYIVTRDGYTLIWGRDGDVYAVNGVINVPVVKGKLSTGTQFKVSDVLASQTKKVNITTSDSESEDASEQSVTTTFIANGGNGATGETLDAGDSPYMTQQICDDLLKEYKGLVYTPFDATNCVFDPAAEIGDQIKIGDTVFSVIYNLSLNLNTAYTVDTVNPGKSESSSEYPYNPESAKVQDLINSLSTNILRMDNSIKLRVARLEKDSDDKYDAMIELLGDYTKTGELITKINASADVITLTGGRLVITTGNFQLDKNGNVTINNGKFKGTIETGVDNDDFGIRLDKGEMTITQRAEQYLRIMPSDWGKGSNPNAPFGAQIRAKSFLAFNDIDGGMYVAVNYGADPNGFTAGFLCFTDAQFCKDVQFNTKLFIGNHEMRDSGTNISVSTGLNLSGNIWGNNFYFNDPPISGSSSTSLKYLLQTLWNKVFG